MRTLRNWPHENACPKNKILRLCYAKDKYRQLYLRQDISGDFHWRWFETPSGERRKLTNADIEAGIQPPANSKVFRLVSMWPPSFSAKAVFAVEFIGKEGWPPKGQCWPTNPEGMQHLVQQNRIEVEGANLRYVLYLDDDDLTKLTAIWTDTVGARDKRYVVETSHLVIQRCVLMTTDPGDLILDPTCGSGTTAYVAEQWGRRWITCDTARVAITLAKQQCIRPAEYMVGG